MLKKNKIHHEKRVTLTALENMAKNDKELVNIVNNPGALDTLSATLNVSAGDYEKSSAPVKSALRITLKALEYTKNASDNDELAENISDSNLVRSLLGLTKEFSTCKFDAQPVLLDSLQALNLALKIGSSYGPRVLEAFYPQVDGLINYRFDATCGVQNKSLECITELFKHASRIPFQTAQIFEKVKESPTYPSVASCLDYKSKQPQKINLTNLKQLSLQALESLAEFVHPVEGEILPFPALVSDPVQNISDSVSECSQDVTVRHTVAAVLLQKAFIPKVVEFATGKDTRARVLALRILYQCSRFNIEFAKYLGNDKEFYSQIFLILNIKLDSNGREILYEQELAILLSSVIIRETPSLSKALETSITMLTERFVNIMDSRYRCIVAYLLAVVARCDPKLKSLIVTHFFSSSGLLKCSDLLMKNFAEYSADQYPRIEGSGFGFPDIGLLDGVLHLMDEMAEIYLCKDFATKLQDSGFWKVFCSRLENLNSSSEISIEGLKSALSTIYKLAVFR